MARALRSLLAPEGSADADFLTVVLRRMMTELCRSSDIEIDVADPIDVRTYKSGRSPKDVIRTISANINSTDVVFVHADGGIDKRAAERRFVEPIRVGCPDMPVVAVVPVRETEAWILADRAAVGTTFPRTRRIVDWPKQPESLVDPKATLGELVALGVGRHRLTRIPFAQLGERVDLEVLGRLPSFAATAEALTAALRATGYVP